MVITTLFYAACFLSVFLLFPVQKVSYIIGPLAVLSAILFYLYPDYSGITDIDQFPFPETVSIPLAGLLLISLLTRLSSAWIVRSIADPLPKMYHKQSPYPVDIPFTLLIMVQTAIFLRFFESPHFWEILSNVTMFKDMTLISCIRTISFHLGVLILPILIIALFIQMVVLLGGAFTLSKKFAPLFSLCHALGLLFGFYYSLPLISSCIEGLL
jgi:hypothetical protein